MSAAALIYCTCPSRAEALRIGQAVVEARLAACANVLDGMTSVYRWQGRIEQASEAVLILKTRSELASAATERVRSLHAYDVPAILVLPVTGGHAPFLNWIAAETDCPHDDAAMI
ncbi:MAG: divalent-cation tolerance protein CutA [Planctomyces sp.]|nr:divalent-cation tolerance protein CutA [Planctomyces sp.]